MTLRKLIKDPKNKNKLTIALFIFLLLICLSVVAEKYWPIKQLPMDKGFDGCFDMASKKMLSKDDCIKRLNLK